MINGIRVIDVQNHIFPLSCLKLIGRESKVISIIRSEDGEFILHDNITNENFNPLPMRLYLDPQERINENKKYGVDVQVLSMPNPGPDRFGEEVAVKLCEKFNDEVSKIIEKYPENYTGFACIPFSSVEKAVEEVKRAIKDLGFKGIMAYNNVNGKFLDSSEFYPIYKTIESLQVPIYVHPTIPIAAKLMGPEYNLNMIFRWPYETTIALTRIAYSGLLDMFPNIKFIFSHAGGMVSFFSARLELLHEAHTEKLTGKKLKQPIETIRKMYVDLAIYGYIPAAKTVLSFFTPNNVLFASDYPFGPKGGIKLLEVASEMMSKIDLPIEDKEKILEKNASSLLRA